MPEINSYDDIARHLSDHQCSEGYDCLCHACVNPDYTVVTRHETGVVIKVEQYLGGECVHVADLSAIGSWCFYARDATANDKRPIRPGSLEDLVKRAYDAGALALSGHRVDNGGDFYRCPGCYESKETMGFADPVNPDLSDVDHKPGCALVALVEAAKKL
jgi:hypothetical protein